MIQKLQDIPELKGAIDSNAPVVLCAADDNYVKPLAVMLRSAAESLQAGNSLSVIVLDGGIEEANWVSLKESLANLPIQLFSIRPSFDEVQSLVISHHITHTAYLRLLAGRLLPDSIDKVIYLDSDVLVCDDLTKLWDRPLGDAMALAVPDIACPFVDARFADCNFEKSSPYLAAISPIGNWRELGLNPAAPYFNSGVLVMNIKRMREEHVEQKLLDCLTQNEKYVWCWDQYALNIVFANQWKPLPLRWNQGAHVFEFPDEEFSPLNSEEFLEARECPAIIHFTTEWKPWHYANQHPLKQMFFDQLDETVWANWRPEKPDFSVKSAWLSFATEFVKQLGIHYRKISNLFRKPRFAVGVQGLPEMQDLVVRRPSPNIVSSFDNEIPELKKQLTIFAIPKPFVGAAKVAQTNAVGSWKQMSEFADIILLGDEKGTHEFANEIGVRHIQGVQTNQHGTPLLSSAFELVREATETPYLAYCNCDVILLQEFRNAITKLILAEQFDMFLAIGRRTNLELNRLVDFDSEQEREKLLEQLQQNGEMDSLVCKEYFVFPRQLFTDIPDFAVGRGNWDNWMVHRAKADNIPVVSLSDSVLAIHQKHDHSHSGGRLGSYVTGSEAKNNQRLAGGRHLVTGSTCDFRLGKNGLAPGYLKSFAGEFWMDFHRFGRLLMDLLSSRKQ